VLTFLPHLRVLCRTWQLKFRVEHLWGAIPFLLVGLSGMLQSRTDLYIVSLLRGDAETGVYQVTISCFLYAQALAGMVILPFTANLYRLKPPQVLRLAARFTAVGVLALLVLILPSIYFLLNWAYHFNHGWTMYLWGGLYIFPIFAYALLIIVLYGKGKEKEVMWANFAGALLNLLLTPLLLEWMQLEGAVLASALAQWGLLAYFIYRVRKV